MTRNQIIGIGCGAAGCLGLIVVIAGGAVYWYTKKSSSRYQSNYNRDSNRNSNTNDAPVSNLNNSAPGSLSATEENQHRLYQAANVAGDKDLLERVNRKLGLHDAQGDTTDEYPGFLADHLRWILRSTKWIKSSINTPKEARAYVEEHIDD